MAYENIDRQVKSSRPDLIEILPALMPKVIAKSLSVHLHTGHCRRAGLRKGRHPRSFLDAGATSISSTNEKIWFL